MRRVTGIRRAVDWAQGTAIDRVVLDADDRQRRRVVLTGENGTSALLDFENQTGTVPAGTISAAAILPPSIDCIESAVHAA